MTELLPQGTSTWPSNFTAGLHAALRRRIPPQAEADAPALEELSRDLVLALEQGELTVALTPERLAAAQASGWLEGDASPLLLQGDRLGWRRWLQAMEQVVAELVERAQAPLPKPVEAADPELSDRLNAEQCAAVRALDQASVVLLSGGPGTGKTSTVVEILARAEATASGLQPAVEGAAGQRSPLRHHRLPQAPGSLAGGGRQTDAQAGMAGFRPGQNLHHRAGFARARTTAEQHHRGLIQGASGGALFSVETIRQLGIGSLDRFGKRSMGPLHQLGHHLLHGLQPAAPSQPITLEQQGRGVPLQPATGLSSCQPLRRQRHRQLPLFQGQHQIAAELLQGGAISPGRDPSPQGGMESAREVGGPDAGSLGQQLRHAGTSPRARSRAAMRLSGTGSTMRPGPTASSSSGEAVTAPGIPRRKQ